MESKDLQFGRFDLCNELRSHHTSARSRRHSPRLDDCEKHARAFALSFFGFATIEVEDWIEVQLERGWVPLHKR